MPIVCVHVHAAGNDCDGANGFGRPIKILVGKLPVCPSTCVMSLPVRHNYNVILQELYSVQFSCVELYTQSNGISVQDTAKEQWPL